MSDLFCFTGVNAMSNKAKSAIFSSVQYLIIFIGFAISYMFTYPQYDVLLFTRDFKGDFISVLHEAINYGNGRLLGNIFGFYFSHHFTAAIFATAFFLTLIVFLSNRLFFDGNRKTAFPIAVCIAFPAVGLMREVYSMIAAFCNYAVPFAFALMSGVLIKRIKSGESRLLYIPFAVSTVGACLFSENTTVVMLCAAVLIIVGDLCSNKKVSESGIVNFIFTLIGTLIMYLIPRLTETQEKLSGYRGFVTEPKALIYNIIAAVRSFSLLANQYVLVYAAISAVMIYVLFKQCKTYKAVKIMLTAVLTAVPLLGIFAVIFAEKANKFAMLFLMLELAYLVTVLIVSILSKQRKLIFSFVMTVILLCSAVGPMTIVNHRGDRTFYTTFAILFCYAMFLIKEIGIGDKVNRFIGIFAPTTFIVGCCVMLTITAQNFDSYAYRAEYLARKSVASDSIDVPYLAHGRLATETTLGQIDPCLFNGEINVRFNVIPANEWEMSDEYKRITHLPPIDAVKYGLNHWEFKDATYPAKLRNEYLKENK